MIIGISGKIGTGKDEVGKIIQFLTANIAKKCTYIEAKEYEFNYEVYWNIKKFAFAVKQVCSILTGIPVEDFEKEEIKNTGLGGEWDYLSKGWIPSYNNPDNKGLEPNAEPVTMTVRQLLQKVGTDAIRNQVHPNAWVNALFTDYKEQDYVNSINSNWIITDVRFPNEAKAIKDRGGIIIRVNREWLTVANEKGNKTTINHLIPLDSGKTNIESHISETALDDYTFDYTIDNNGTIEELIEKVKEILIKEKII
jgi:hypothetical protein